VSSRSPLESAAERRPQSLDVTVVARDTEDVGKVVEALAAQGLRVERMYEPEAVAAAVVGGRPDVIVVDLRDDDGLADRMLTWVSRHARCASLVVSGADDVDARIAALHLGADDHVVAPFETREAVARVQALIARRRSVRRAPIEAGDLVIDPAQRCITRGGETVPLTPREADLLMALVNNADQPLSKRDLLDIVWGAEDRSENVVEANVSSLRRKLHALGPPVIHTVHRTGYVFRRTASEPSLTRRGLVAERERLLRERDEVVARREDLMQRLRDGQRELRRRH
jgi:two-component system, OmpR family, response regulator